MKTNLFGRSEPTEKPEAEVSSMLWSYLVDNEIKEIDYALVTGFSELDAEIKKLVGYRPTQADNQELLNKIVMVDYYFTKFDLGVEALIAVFRTRDDFIKLHHYFDVNPTVIIASDVLRRFLTADCWGSVYSGDCPDMFEFLYEEFEWSPKQPFSVSEYGGDYMHARRLKAKHLYNIVPDSFSVFGINFTKYNMPAAFKTLIPVPSEFSLDSRELCQACREGIILSQDLIERTKLMTILENTKLEPANYYYLVPNRDVNAIVSSLCGDPVDKSQLVSLYKLAYSDNLEEIKTKVHDSFKGARGAIYQFKEINKDLMLRELLLWCYSATPPSWISDLATESKENQIAWYYAISADLRGLNKQLTGYKKSEIDCDLLTTKLFEFRAGEQAYFPVVKTPVQTYARYTYIIAKYNLKTFYFEKPEDFENAVLYHLK